MNYITSLYNDYEVNFSYIFNLKEEYEILDIADCNQLLVIIVI